MSLFISSSDLISLYLLEKEGQTDQGKKHLFHGKIAPFKKPPLLMCCGKASDLDTQK